MLSTEPVRNPSTFSGSGANHLARKYPRAKPKVSTIPAADWEVSPGIVDSQRMRAIMGRHMSTAPTNRATVSRS